MSAKPNFDKALPASILKWLLIIVLIGILAGSASAFFLVALQWVTDFRLAHLVIIWFLPFGGLLIGLLYHYYGKNSEKGNNLILSEYENPREPIPWQMAPLVLSGTLVTHLLGGSAGREGTAVQMGGAIADRFTAFFKLDDSGRRLVMVMGISAGFASVFGTPCAAAVFALEVLSFRKMNYKSALVAVLAAFIAYYTVEIWKVKHTHYRIGEIPGISLENIILVILTGILFGLTAMFFAKTTHLTGKLFSYIRYPPLRPFVGGLLFVTATFFIGTTKFTGLGIPFIVDAFENRQPLSDFALKILFTALTLGSGFKGGEVTPLFFVGAALGSALSFFVPLPVALLAGMGFTAVFSGATHTPLACTVMGMELFGYQCGIYIAIACGAAYFCSGTAGIYASQIHDGPKAVFFKRLARKNLENL